MSLRNLRARLAGAGIELQSAVVAGGAANANIAVPGVKPSDVLVAVVGLGINFAGSTFSLADHLPSTTIPANGAIRINTDTTDQRILVLWWSV